ncbi:MAG: aspartyl/asparaginyl beta-hydroxylase domain-containing protein [Phenylobacterium sp.]|uniref:aspartyl/asparaginyl beta-hydroxylase domain-containing protein n=1 Tax=Phenylobacterium sp. TaxID=1871053 RepID=UPI00391B84FB
MQVLERTHETADAEGAAEAQALAQACRKRSFLKLPLEVDTPRLLAEFAAIPPEAWGASHWDVHCSVDMVLLRGGQNGRKDDFTTEAVANSPVLERLPYIASLLAPEGPLGGAVYAFIFRTKPYGITRQHVDDREAWVRTVRIHIPLVTNPEAVLLSEGRSKHLEVGEAWTFDNQVIHSVSNGGQSRVHMIIDVQPNPKLAALMQAAEWDPGEPDPARWAATGQARRNYPFATGEPLTAAEAAALGLDPEGFATRVTGLKRRAVLTAYSPLRVGDVLYAVNGADRSHLSRTALDHLYMQYGAGEAAQLDVVRGGRRLRLTMRLRAPEFYSASARLAPVLKLLRRPGRPAASSGY